MVYEDEKQDFNNWCANYFGPDSDEQYVFGAVEKCPVVERLQSRIAELEKDAARYLLRLETIRALYPSAPSDIELDTAIDAAMQKD